MSKDAGLDWPPGFRAARERYLRIIDRKIAAVVCLLELDGRKTLSFDRAAEMSNLMQRLALMNMPTRSPTWRRLRQQFDEDYAIDKPIIELFKRLNLNHADYSHWKLLLTAFVWRSLKGAPKKWSTLQYLHLVLSYKAFAKQNPNAHSIKAFCKSYRVNRHVEKSRPAPNITRPDEMLAGFIDTSEYSKYELVRRRLRHAGSYQHNEFFATLLQLGWMQTRKRIEKSRALQDSIIIERDRFFRDKIRELSSSLYLEKHTFEPDQPPRKVRKKSAAKRAGQ